MKRVYLDYAATTPLDERVIQRMMPYWQDDYGNPSSIHWFGQKAEMVVEGAREQIADLLQADSDEIIFTSCGSESDNLALRGMAYSQKLERGADHILISPVEHAAIAQTARMLAKYDGFIVEYLPVDSLGRINPDDLKKYLRKTTAIVSVIYGNNEIGTINPIREIGDVCQRYGVAFHTDAVQAAAYLPMDVNVDCVDLMSLGAHKLYGPKGVGALFIRKGINLNPIITGGKQEFGYRAGTSNVPLIVGFAEALILARQENEDRVRRILPMRDEIIRSVLSEIPGSRLTGDSLHRLPNHASFVFEGVDGNHLISLLDTAGFACSSGSACKSGNPQPSDVLMGIGLSKEMALGSLRVTLGKETTPTEIYDFLQILPGEVNKSHKSSR